MGPRAAVFADHVELADDGLDFASCFGAGGVLATKFVHPLDDSIKARLKEYWALTEEKELQWKKWFEIAAQYSLADGEYLNLYDTAFEFPEAHAIRKEGSIYYAFFTQGLHDHYSGPIQLRGLDGAKCHRVQDYVDGRVLDEVAGNNLTIHVEINGALLLKVTSVENIE
jgi:alpha-galactosidase